MNVVNKENKENIFSTDNISPDENYTFIMQQKREIQDIDKEHPGLERCTTKVYYYIDDQQIPFSTEIPIPPSKITLADFKKYITRKNYRFYCKVMDSALNAEVKTDIRDEHQILQPNSSNGRFELFLLSESQIHPFTHPTQQFKHCGNRTSFMGNMHSTYDMKRRFIEDESSPEDTTNLRLFGESNFASSSLSDGGSQYTTTDFTSVSQQKHQPERTFLPLVTISSNKRYDRNNKPCWTREKRKRTRRSYSALSSTFEDTEISMALDLITVTFNLDTRRPFGMSIITKNNRSGFAGIYVHDVLPGGLVALDGRIRPGFIILEVNDISLDDYDSKEALNLIISAVRNATETRSQLKLACARSESIEPIRSLFQPILSEPVRPIDPTAWVQHTNAARGLDDHVALQGPILQRQCSSLRDPHSHFQSKEAGLKSDRIPKTSLLQQSAAGGPSNTKQFSNFEAQLDIASDANGGCIRMIQNPSTDITTTTSGHSSLECSIGQIQPNSTTKRSDESGRRKKGRKGGKKNGGGVIGSALRRLVCIRTTRKGHKGSSSISKGNAARK